MKVKDGVYFCPWCTKNFNKDIKSIEGAGKKRKSTRPGNVHKMRKSSITKRQR